MDQQPTQTQLKVTEKLEDYFPNNKTRCFRPHYKPNKQMFKQVGIANLQPIDFQELTDCENDTQSKVSDSLAFPYSAIGLLSLKYGQNKFRGSGFLVGPNIVLTAARNLYIHSLQKECEQVKFYPGLHSLAGRECNVKKWYYPPQYKSGTVDQRGEYDFAILELSNDIGLEYGYFGVDFGDQKEKWLQESVHIYGYPGCVFENKKQLDTLHCMYGGSGNWIKESENRLKYKIPTSAGQCGSPIFIKEAQNSYSVVGIHTNGGMVSNSGVLMNSTMKTIINKRIKKIIKIVIVRKNQIMYDNGKIKKQQFTKIIKNIQQKRINQVFLWSNNMGAEGAKFLSQANWLSLTTIYLRYNNIGAEGAKFLSQANWPSLTYIDLWSNNIGAEGAKFLSQANWPWLTTIHLWSNNIGAEGAKFLSQANWPWLTTIHLWSNNIGAEGAKFLSQANWPSLTTIDLRSNNIGAEGAKFLSQANWPSLTYIDLDDNNIGAEGAKFLSQANWPWLTTIDLGYNSIGAEEAKFLSQANWPSLTTIDLRYNSIGAEGAKFLRSIQWSADPNFKILL